MNFTESFQEFSTKIGPTDLALYAGAGIVLFILFKDKLSPVQKILIDIKNRIKDLVGNKKNSVDVNSTVVPISNETLTITDNEDVFFKLVVSWKQTRDLAVLSGCTEAVKVADEMFPFLSPNVCKKEEVK